MATPPGPRRCRRHAFRRTLADAPPSMIGWSGPRTADVGPRDASVDTIYLTVVDKDRNAVSFINSIITASGSARVRRRAGWCCRIAAQISGSIAGHPNCIAPGKRPMHTIIPAMVTKGGHALVPFAVMGGNYQPVGQAAVPPTCWTIGLRRAGSHRHAARPASTRASTAEDSVPAEHRRGPEEDRAQDQVWSGRSAAARRSGSTGTRARWSAAPIPARTVARWDTKAFGPKVTVPRPIPNIGTRSRIAFVKRWAQACAGLPPASAP